jgi:hypothetical protein
MHTEATFTVCESLFRWQGKAAWHFIRLVGNTSQELSAKGHKRGWGSIKVAAEINGVRWETSVFPDKDGSYLLPIKASVRNQAGLQEGDAPQLVITLIS